LVHLALAAVVLPAGWTWALVALSLACSGGLFYGHRWLSLDYSQPQSHAQHMQMHLQGMWIAFGVAAGFIVYFVTRVRRALAAQRAVAARNERLASLATLAAGAAHELATPLGTIAVAVREIERQAERGGPASLEDARLIREQVERCRAILHQLSADAGESAGEAPTRTPLALIVQHAVRDLAPAPPVRAELGPCEAAQLVLPRRVLAQAVRAIVKNAQEATPPGGAVTVTASPAAGALALVVADAGAGMSRDVLARAGEPFFTTKPPGKGMGLGLFLARTVVEQLGGGLQIQSDPGRGTLVTIVLPLDGAT
jgi:two-component system sensor histidine kinase RegB